MSRRRNFEIDQNEKIKKVDELISKMYDAHNRDLEVKPAIAKLSLVDEVVDILGKISYQELFVEGGGLKVISLWLSPIDSTSELPPLGIRRKLIPILHDKLFLFINKDHLRESNLGITIKELYNHKDELPENKQMEGFLINGWVKMIMGN